MIIDEAVEYIFNEWDNLDPDDQKQLLDDLCSVADMAADREVVNNVDGVLDRALRKLEKDYTTIRDRSIHD